MEVEISSRLLNCSGDRMAAMVANDSHVILRTKSEWLSGPRVVSLITPHATPGGYFSGIFEEGESGVRSS